MDHFIHDLMIVNLMCLIFEDTRSGWYEANTEYALDFFSGPAFLAYAIEQLGYPTLGLGIGGYTPNFNLKVEDGT
jgi:hypothetical protein